jgi:hypothetical protein
MSLITNIIIAIPIGLLYNLIVHKLCETLNVGTSYSRKLQNNLIIIISFSIIGFVIAYHSKKNKSLKYGLYFGSLLLFLHSFVYNWYSMSNDTKVIIAFFCFVCLIWYSFSNSKNNKNITDDNDDEDELIDDDITDEFTDDNNLINYPDVHIEKYTK